MLRWEECVILAQIDKDLVAFRNPCKEQCPCTVQIVWRFSLMRRNQAIQWIWQLARELSPASSEHVMPSSGQGTYILELSRRISSINQLTRTQRASLTKDQLIAIFSYMANHPSVMGFGLTHRGGLCQPSEEGSSPSDQHGADQDISSEMQNAPAGPSRLVQPARGGRVKECAWLA